jgi:hypothetical protein
VADPPPSRAPVAAGNKKWILIAGASALVTLAVLVYALRPKSQPAPIASHAQIEQPAAPATPQGQADVQIPPAPVTAASPPPGVPAASSPDVPQASTSDALTVPADTQITVRTTGKVSTRSNQVGDAISGAIDAPVVVGSRVAIPRGAKVTLRIASIDESISLQLSTLILKGKQYNLIADTYESDTVSKPRKGVLGRVGGLVHKRRNESAEAVVPSKSILTFTLRAPVQVVP